MTDESGQTRRQTKTPKRKGGRPRKARGASNTSDAADARWTVRGVPSNVRSMAVEGADNQGKTVGDWLAEAIVFFSKADDKRVSADGSPNLTDQKLSNFMQAVDDRLTQLEKPSFLKRLLGG